MSQPNTSPFIPINIIQRILRYSKRSQKRIVASRGEFGDLTRQAAEHTELELTQPGNDITYPTAGQQEVQDESR